MIARDPSNPSWGRTTASQRHHQRRALIVRRAREMVRLGVLPEPSDDGDEQP